MQIVIDEPRVLEAVDSGSYTAKFNGIDLVEGKFGTAYRLSFVITEGDFEGRRVTGICSMSSAPGSKFHTWLSAIFGGGLESGAEVDVDVLVGNLCTVLVGHKQNGDRTYANVTSVIPCRGEKEDAAAEGDTGSEAAAEVEEDIPF